MVDTGAGWPAGNRATFPWALDGVAVRLSEMAFAPAGMPQFPPTAKGRVSWPWRTGPPMAAPRSRVSTTRHGGRVHPRFSILGEGRPYGIPAPLGGTSDCTSAARAEGLRYGGFRERRSPMRKLGSTLCALLAAASAGAAPPPWLEVKSAHFTVVTNSGEKAGRRTAWQFEQIHSALVHLWPWARIDSGRPFFVFAVRDEATLKTLGPEYWEGKRYRPISFGASGRERQFIALRTDIVEPDEIGSNPYQSAYWSYVSTVFNRSFPRPLHVWYSRGIAEVMSNTIVRDKELHVGRPIRGNLELLQRALIPLNEFLTADHRSHWLRQESDAQLFDAQAWALVHYLLFGEKGVHAARVNRFSQLLHGGASDEAALKEAFGDMTPYHDGMRGYVRR